jgi:hypothetical protein
MVKRTSSLASNKGFRVRILVEALCPWCSRLAHDAVTVEVGVRVPPDTLVASLLWSFLNLQKTDAALPQGPPRFGRPRWRASMEAAIMLGGWFVPGNECMSPFL